MQSSTEGAPRWPSLFGQSPAETAGQVLSATAFGFAYAGARLHVGSIWALAVLHGLSNFSQDRLAGEVPGPMYLAVAVLLAAYGLVLVRVAERSAQEGSTDTNGDG